MTYKKAICNEPEKCNVLKDKKHILENERKMEKKGQSYLFVTKNVERPESRSILSMGTIDVSSLIYLIDNQKIGG